MKALVGVKRVIDYAVKVKNKTNRSQKIQNEIKI